MMVMAMMLYQNSSGSPIGGVTDRSSIVVQCMKGLERIQAGHRSMVMLMMLVVLMLVVNSHSAGLDRY